MERTETTRKIKRARKLSLSRLRLNRHARCYLRSLSCVGDLAGGYKSISSSAWFASHSCFYSFAAGPDSALSSCRRVCIFNRMEYGLLRAKNRQYHGLETGFQASRAYLLTVASLPAKFTSHFHRTTQPQSWSKLCRRRPSSFCRFRQRSFTHCLVELAP
jgi:hypothetical protein